MQYLKIVAKHIRHTIAFMLRDAGLALQSRGAFLQNDISYKVPYIRHKTIVEFIYSQPQIHPTVTLCPSSTIAASVFIGEYTKICFSPVRIGSNCVIGDSCSIQCTPFQIKNVPSSVNIGNNVSIMNGTRIYSSCIDDNVTIGYRCIILEGSMIHRGAIILPNSVVPAGSYIPAETIWGGNPVEYKGKIKEQTKQMIQSDILQLQKNI